MCGSQKHAQAHRFWISSAYLAHNFWMNSLRLRHAEQVCGGHFSCTGSWFLGFWPASSWIYLSSTLICPDMQLPAPTHEMSGNARIVRSEAVWHEEFDAISNLRFRLGPPPHPALGLAQYSHKGHPAYAIDRWCLFTLGCFFSVTLMRNPCSQTWKPYRPFLGARGI